MAENFRCRADIFVIVVILEAITRILFFRKRVVRWNMGYEIGGFNIAYCDCPFNNCATQHIIKPPDMGFAPVEITYSILLLLLITGRRGMLIPISESLFDVPFREIVTMINYL